MPASNESNESSDGSEERETSAHVPRVYHSEELFHGQKEIWIMHGEMLYRLKITSTGKLVLHK